MKSYSLDNSLRESIFREDLFLYNCLLQRARGDVQRGRQELRVDAGRKDVGHDQGGRDERDRNVS